ncbi:hypothetical protein KP509_20G003000 [Ceratopteris richardii]|uniref:Uncharacterized protein n=1 Tax=Ceratopteris richardii TaxID=49495 RepID=A0A8T2SE44_CERRI|nr:hypothetical protein KP509_20G003000 [Ceratopteris richardii]
MLTTKGSCSSMDQLENCAFIDTYLRNLGSHFKFANVLCLSDLESMVEMENFGSDDRPKING